MSKSPHHKLRGLDEGSEIGEFAKFSKKIPLTKKEQIVFYGLVEFPELNDKKLSKKLKIKRSTVTAIRNKLRRQSFYSPRVIPNFRLLGYELMSFIWGKSSLPSSLEEKMKIPAIKNAMQLPENIFQIITDTDFFSCLIFKNFTEFKKIEDSYAHVYKNYSAKESNVNIVHFPLEMSEISSLFDYSQLLKYLFKLKFEEKKTVSKPETLIKLKEKEKIVFCALAKYPELNDVEIAKKINITRQTVSKIKSKLIKLRQIKLVNEPDFKKIGCELFVNTHIRFNPQIDLNKRRLLLDEPKKKCPMIFDVESNTEELCTGLFEDYLSFKTAQDDLTKVYGKHDLLLKEPITQIIPIPQIKLYKTNFVSITEKALGIKIP